MEAGKMKVNSEIMIMASILIVYTYAIMRT